MYVPEQEMLWLVLSEDQLLIDYLRETLDKPIYHLEPSKACPQDSIQGICRAVEEKVSGETSPIVLLVDAALFPAVPSGNRFGMLQLLRKLCKTRDSAVMTIIVITSDLRGEGAQAYDAGADLILEGRFDPAEVVSFAESCVQRQTHARWRQKWEKVRERLWQIVIALICTVIGLIAGSFPSCRNQSSAKLIGRSWYASMDVKPVEPNSILCRIGVEATSNSFPSNPPIKIAMLPPKDLVQISGIEENHSTIELKGKGDRKYFEFTAVVKADIAEIKERLSQFRVELSGPGFSNGDEYYRVYFPESFLLDRSRNSHPQARSLPDPLPGNSREGQGRKNP